MKNKWKKVWVKEYKVTKNNIPKLKYRAFQITKYKNIKSNAELFFTSTSPKRTYRTCHGSFGEAYQFGNKGWSLITNY